METKECSVCKGRGQTLEIVFESKKGGKASSKWVICTRCMGSGREEKISQQNNDIVFDK
jgi:DnaJ-class molecular chaperone